MITVSNSLKEHWVNNRTTLCTALAALALVVTAVGLGIIVVVFANVHQLHPIIPSDMNMNEAAQINRAYEYLEVIGGIGDGALYGGIGLFCIGFGLRRYYNKKDSEKKDVAENIDSQKNSIATDVWVKRKTYACLLVGAFAAAFFLGMVIALGGIKSHCSDMQSLINAQPRWSEHIYFWNALQSIWVDPMQKMMETLLPVGTIGMVAGGALFGYGLLTKMGYKGFKACGSRCQEEPSDGKIPIDEKL